MAHYPTTRSLIYDVPDGEANLFGYLAYDTKYRTFGFVNLQSQSPGAYSLTKDYGNVVGQTPSLQAGTFVGDEYIVYEATIYQNAIMPPAFRATNPTIYIAVVGRHRVERHVDRRHLRQGDLRRRRVYRL